MTDEQFWAKVDRDGECWEWAAARNSKGYGSLCVGGKWTMAHRHAYALTHGPIAKGLVVRHTCDNPPCVNPAHLLLGTYSDNMRDALERGRHGQASKTHCPLGHAYEGGNVRVYRDRARYCRECDSIRKHARWRKTHPDAGPHNGEKTHCKRGHEFTPENTYVWPGNLRSRACRACMRERARKAA